MLLTDFNTSKNTTFAPKNPTTKILKQTASKMIPPAIPENEEERLKALYQYQILDTLPEDDFDELTKLASEICETPISFLTLVDRNRQWFKSRHGLELVEIPRELGHCSHTILTPNEVMVVEDVFKDERFFDNPALTGDPAAVFYAGVPLVNPEGFALGSLCVIDTEVRRLSEQQLSHLKIVANQVMKQLELRRKIVEVSETQQRLKQTNKELEASNEELTRFASIVSHDLKSPLNTITALSDMLKEEYQTVLDELGLEQLTLMKECALELSEMVVGIYEYSRWGSYFKEKREATNLSKILKKTVKLLSPPNDVEVVFSKELPSILTFKIALEQIFSNLINNAIKYNDKSKGRVEVTYSATEKSHVFQVIDNGQGIPENKKMQIFDIFQTLGKTDRFDEKGTGVGLAIVLQLVKKMNGEILVESEIGKGSTFQFSIEKQD